MSDTKIKTSNIGNLAVTHALLHTDMDLTSKTVQVATPTSNTHPATKLYVDTEVANLIDSAPGTLDTLNELAAAINDDANFNATIASSIATKLPLAGGTLTGNLTLASTASGSSASPELELRRDITGVDANYLGQIKFTADNDADQNVVFAKITGKILDASDGTEDGIIEFAHKKAGSNNISARFRSDSLQLINGTNLTVAGTTELTGNVGIGATPSSAIGVYSTKSLANGLAAELTNTESSTGSGLVVKGGNNSSTYSADFRDYNNTTLMRVRGDGNVGIGTNSPSDKLTIQSSTGQLRLQGTTNTNKNISIFYNESGDYGQINVDESGVNQKDLWVTGLNLKFGRSTSSESMRIKDDGRLLIGTDTSSVYYNSTSQYAGDVVVDMNIANNVTDLVLINSNNSFGSTVDFATNNSAGNPIRHGLIGAVPDSTTAGSESGHLIFSTKNTTDNNIVERMRIASDGDVTFKSAGVVTLKAAPLGSTYGAGFDVITVTGTSSAPYTSTIGFSNYSKTNAMVIQGDNVGIGTSSPGALFEVSGNTKKSRFTRSGSAGTLVEYYYGSNITAGIQVQSTGLGIGGAARENDLFIKTDGKIGIGTSNPITKLHVSDGSSATTARFDRGSSYIFDMKIDNLVSGSAIDLLWEPQQANSGHLFRTRDSGNNTVNALSITRGGDVGIGTLDPDAELHVEGTIYANNGHTVKSVTTVGTGLGEQRHRYFRHIATGVGNETFKLMRYARHWWGTGWFQIIIRGTYYGSNSKYGVFTVNGHTRNGLASVQSHINNVGTATPYADNYNSTHEACDISITLPQYEQYNIEFNILASSPQTAEANVGHHVGNSNAFFLHGTVREFI
jgi:hypothetical protein